MHQRPGCHHEVNVLQPSKGMTDTTKLLISQRISTVMKADRILCLEDGKYRVRTHEELLAGCSAYQAIYNSQIGQGWKDRTYAGKAGAVYE